MKTILDIVRGIVIGIANVIPGVSGGTMAVSMGIYDKLIGAVNGLTKNFMRSVRILAPLLVGMAIGVVGFSYLIEYLLAQHTLATCLTFVGLILGGLPVLWPSLKKSAAKKPGGKAGISEALAFLVLLAVGVGMPLLQGGSEGVQTLTPGVGMALLLVVLGLIASATMVIPGVSGSMVLMILGYYYGIINAVTGTISALKALDFGGVFQGVLLLAPFGIGVLLGILLIAKLIDWLFDRFPSQTYAAIIGLVVSSPFAILYASGALAGGINWIELVVGIVLGAAGAWVTLLMGEKE